MPSVGWLKFKRSIKYHFFIGERALCGGYISNKRILQKQMVKKPLYSDENCKDCVQLLVQILNHLEDSKKVEQILEE